MDFQINSLYLCVSDMDRAIGFYEDFLEQSVTVRDKVYSVFDVHGFRLGLFAYGKCGRNMFLAAIACRAFPLQASTTSREKQKDSKSCSRLQRLERTG